MSVEIKNLRTYKSKTFDNGDGTRTAEIHCGHIHYKDSSGNFQDVDYTIEDKGAYWQVVKANYRLYVAKNFTDSQLIRFDNKFEGANHTIYYEPHSLQWVHKTTHDRVLIKASQNVTGTLDGDTITYPNAFGNNIDFVVQLKRHGFQKYVRFNVKPALTPPSSEYVLVMLVKYTGINVSLKAKDLSVWDGESYYESEEGFDFLEANSTLKSFTHKAYIEDANENRQNVKLFWEKRNNVLWQAKVLPRVFLNNATYPVIADADTFYTGAGDGMVNEGGNATWAVTHDATSGNNASYTDTDHLAGQCGYESTPNYYIKRGFFPFDTSGLPDVATITAATLTLYVHALNEDDSDSEAFLNVVKTYQADPTELVTADYEDCGCDDGNDEGGRAKETPITVGATEIALSSMSVDSDIVFTLNATGLGWIDKTGWTKLGTREGHDLEDNAFNAVSGNNGVRVRMSEYTGTGDDPLLSVTYVIPMSGTIAATSSLTAALSVKKSLAAQINGVSALTAALSIGGLKSMAATITASSGMTGALSVKRSLAASIDAVSALTSALTIAKTGLAAQIAGSASLSASMNVKRSMAATVAAVSELTASLGIIGTVPMAAVMAAVSALEASMSIIPAKGLISPEVEQAPRLQGSNIFQWQLELCKYIEKHLRFHKKDIETLWTEKERAS